ncbi:glycosyltransferase family 4 protein [Pseudoalteromonas sp. SR45-4]|uniref:glycosyltransferase family 4 protein n=1 Tax=Pseudoalteromonas sp. SR45-4 TaxID=2760929 RepID=UPI0015FA04C0|nr:glycosyltransferase family 4 protein [Pseudoalteromonas sp. SR45-4]MBB1372609.1 glycosyltransferase family 4 protein [Pseudoalteromonas sp. SR45-4]
MKKNFLLVHLLNDFSGSPLVLANCIDALIDNNCQVELITSKDNGFLSRCDVKKNLIQYKRFNIKLFTLFSFILSQIVFFLMLFFKTFFIKKEDKPTVLINTILPFGAALGAKLGGCHIVYYVHEISIRPQILKKWLKWVLNNTADKAIYVSNYLKETEGANIQCIEEYVVYNSLPKQLDQNSSILKNKVFTVFMPSSLKKYKGVYDFVILAQTLEKKNIRFILALNADENDYDNFLNSIDIPANLEVIRRPDDINKIYTLSSLVLNLSNPNEWVETFGMTVIEGFAHGCPAIVPTVGGITEIVEEGMNGFKISVNDIDEIAEKINMIASNCAMHNALVSNALITADNFQFSEYKKNILEVL